MIRDLKLIDRHRIYLAMEERNDLFTDFLVDNEGQLCLWQIPAQRQQRLCLPCIRRHQRPDGR